MSEPRAAGIHCTLTIEATDGVAENDALLANAHTHRWIAGVVGWVPLAQPTDAKRMLESSEGESS